ncbi:regulatory protein RecX [Inediibacterium massiliense]|uniref:regulatory protein RecX n=1 Tax=Inediibacterium massiliense TaxID=1658111 RepID=UPI0006B45991|nr:RecX family transcriptional regulator [Inediibacterium massiliense]
MSVITKIEQQKNQKRINLYIDDEFFMGMDLEIFYKLHLKEGQCIDQEKIKEIIHEEMYLKAKNKSLQFLKFSGRTQKEMEKKLKDQGYEDHIIHRVINFLMEYGWINDEEMAKYLVKSKLEGKKYGKNRIKQELQQKGVENEWIENALEEEFNEEKEYENARLLALRKRKSIKDEDSRKIYEKIGRYLVYKGYGYDLIRKVLDEILKKN